jgi:hypothetical protein
LLIPSFSSKGFARSKKDGRSEIGEILRYAAEFLTDSYLISAYDVYYKDIPSPAELPTSLGLIFVDSGGYETSTDKDYSSVIDPLPPPRDWDIEKLRTVLDSWPDELPAVFVNFDHYDERAPFLEQVKAARRLFKKYPGHLHLFLIKPETKEQTTLNEVIKVVIANVGELTSFDIVGVTEKELGPSMLDRMVRIAKLRRSMDEVDIQIPIHVFGALDPISVCLYFISGAEIFDGLTWIRYTFNEGQCVYTHNVGALKYGLHMRDSFVRTRSLSDNYYAIQLLEHRIREFEATKIFDKLEPHGRLIRDAVDSLNTRLKGRD